MRSLFHWFRTLNRYWLFDVLHGSLFEVDHDTIRVLDWIAENEAAACREANVCQQEAACPDQIPGVESSVLKDIWNDLHVLGLFTAQVAELPRVKQNRPASLKALCLHIAHDCNLRCRYCFGETGAFGGDRSLMPPEIAFAAVDLLLRESGPYTNLELDFFGGEPLLNFDTVKKTVAYGRQAAQAAQKTIHFTLTTNSYNLDDEKLEYLNTQGISLVLSADGRPAVHDYMRPDAGGQATSERILKNICRAVRSRNDSDYYVRGTFTRHNLDFASDVKFLYDQGFRSISVEPVIAGPDAPYGFREQDLPGIFAEYDKLAQFCLECAIAGDPLRYFHFAVDLDHGPCILKLISGCGAGYDYLAVTPAGDLYPCHQFVGRDGFRMGHVTTGIGLTDLRQAFGAADLFAKEGCTQCWARFLCSGGCHANAHLINGDILKPDRVGCALLKKRMECALGLQGAIKELKQETAS